MRRLLPDRGPRDDAAQADAALDDAELVEAYRLPPGRSLRVNFVASLDGAITVDGRSAGLGSPGDKQIFDLLRALADVVLVGHGTAAGEGYGPITADSAVGRLRSSMGRPATAPIAVVSRRASLDPAGKLVPGAPSATMLITCEAADRSRRAALTDAGVTVLVCGQDDVHIPTALDALADLGYEQVLSEGGPQLLRASLAAGAVDELDLSIAPVLVGGEARLLYSALPAVVRFALAQLLEEDGMLFARYGRPPAA